MKLRTVGIVTTIGMIAALTLASSAAADHGGGSGGGRRLSATLTGAAEVPGPGDLDGSGTVVLKVRPDRDQVCFDIHVAAITLPAMAAHIHQGPVGVAGAIVVTLGTPDSTGNASGCVSASHDLLKAIKQNPSAYYVNVHTTDLPNGALRGQLATSSGQGQGQGSDKFQTSLKGKNEVPGPGDTDGSGSADITVDRSLNQVCFTIHVSGVTLPATAAHIHQGATGIAGPIVVTLTPPDANGSSSGCAVVTPDLVNAIMANPSEYYVNVHTMDFPNGALRGQLSGTGNGCGGDGDEGGGGNGGGDGDGEHVAAMSSGGAASAHVWTISRGDGGGCGDDGDGGGDGHHHGGGDGGGHHHGGGGGDGGGGDGGGGDGDGGDGGGGGHHHGGGDA